MTLVKICGLSTAESLDVALDAGADLVAKARLKAYCIGLRQRFQP